MKAAPFEYSRPATVDEVCELLADDEDARIIAGGQTLVPMMAMRLARPTRLVDIARIAELSYISVQNGHLAIGATMRQCMVEDEPAITANLPLLAAVMPWIGHAATRARGTIGGSLANGDPAAELALIAVTLDATLTFRKTGQNGEIAAADFFLGPTVTALPPAACLTGVKFPIWREGRVGVGFHEVNARRSDFAFVSAAAQVVLDADGVCRRAAIGIGAISDAPMRLRVVEQALIGQQPEPSKLRVAIDAALADIEVNADLHASATYRRRVAATLALRAIADACDTAKRGTHAG